jgi:hypothetical protein
VPTFGADLNVFNARTTPPRANRPISANDEVASFYGKLLRVLEKTSIFRDGAWSLIEPQPAWPGNWTSDGFVACAWAEKGDRRYLVVVNYAGNQGQCRLPHSRNFAAGRCA